MINKFKRRNGTTYYRSAVSGKIVSRKAYLHSLPEVALQRETLSKGEKISLAAAKRDRIGGQFISKRQSEFLNKVFESKGIKKDNQELSNYLPKDLLRDILDTRKEVTENISKSSVRKDYKSHKYIESFNIFKEFAKKHKEGVKFRIGGKIVSYSQLIKAIQEFKEEQEAEDDTATFIYIWKFKQIGDGDEIDLDFNATTVIKS